MFGIDDAILLGGGAALASGFLGADASKSAASTTAGAADRATQAQQQNFQQTRSDLSPFLSGGTSALQQLMRLTGNAYKPTGQQTFNGDLYLQQNPDVAADPFFSQNPYAHYQQYGQKEGRQATFNSVDDGTSSPDFGALTKPFSYSLADFYKDPSYEFQQAEGEKALTRGAASRGLAQSTPGLKALMQWNQDYANTAYSGAFNRAFGTDQANKQTTYNFLSGMAGLGENAGAQTGNVGANAASGIASSTLAGGAAVAGGITGSASAINNSIQGGLGNYMYNQRYQQTMGLYGNMMNSNATDPNFALDAGASLRRSG